MAQPIILIEGTPFWNIPDVATPQEAVAKGWRQFPNGLWGKFHPYLKKIDNLMALGTDMLWYQTFEHVQLPTEMQFFDKVGEGDVVLVVKPELWRVPYMVFTKKFLQSVADRHKTTYQKVLLAADQYKKEVESHYRGIDPASCKEYEHELYSFDETVMRFK